MSFSAPSPFQPYPQTEMGDESRAATSPSASSSPSSSLLLSDERRSSLLRTIVSEGGFAYVTSLESAAGGDLRAAEAAKEMAWEQLHSGPWHEVGSAWRDAYALACLHVADIRCLMGDPGEALKVLDMGIIMGGPLLKDDLHADLRRIKSISSSPSPHPPLSHPSSFTAHNYDLHQMLNVLPKRSLSCKIIEKRISISLEAFICDYFLKSSPVIISGCIDHWPARMKWKDFEYLKRIAGDRTVPVEVGKNYLASEWKQELITFSQFLERIKFNDCPASMTYLAQHPLFDQIQELRNDIMIPDYCFAGGGDLQSINAWFGPAGTVTPLHHDPHHNIFAQVVGRKYIRLYPPTMSEDLYPYTETMLNNSSQVDLDDLNVKEFPRAESLNFLDCILEEGEMIYIPPKWWHYVRSLSASFSVSFWWSTRTGQNSN